MMSNDNWNNLWRIKLVIRGFEMVSSLSVNLSKTRVFSINLQEDFISTAATFLSCDVGIVPFKFLGVVLGSNPRRK